MKKKKTKKKAKKKVTPATECQVNGCKNKQSGSQFSMTVWTAPKYDPETLLIYPCESHHRVLEELANKKGHRVVRSFLNAQ